MQFSYVLCVFVTVCLFVECKMISPSKETIHYHRYEEVDDTCKEFPAQLDDAVYQTRCRPMYVNVPLNYESASHRYLPSVAYVRRCSGLCYNTALSCMPTQNGTRMTKVAARLESLDLDKTKRKKVHVEVEEHTACDCMCRVKKEDCLDGQYIEKECRCVLKCKESQKRDCLKMEKTWNSDDCTCSDNIPCRF